MAYSASGLHRMAGASGVQLWIYQTTDAIAAINTSGYFNDAANMMNVRDLILLWILIHQQHISVLFYPILDQ